MFANAPNNSGWNCSLVSRSANKFCILPNISFPLGVSVNFGLCVGVAGGLLNPCPKNPDSIGFLVAAAVVANFC